MTINSTTRKAGPFIGNGSTSVFPFTFKVFAAADVQAVRLNVSTQVETVLVLGTDYTVSLNADQDSSPGGSITLPSVLATGYNLVITSDIGNLQPTDLTNQGGFYPDVINDSLDRATIQIQQLQEAVDRSAKLPITSTADADALVADIVRLADSADNIDTVAGSITNVNTVATNIASVNTVGTNIASVNTVSTNIAGVNTAASNIAAINAAPGYASDAAASAILANDWATKTSGPVAGGEYSAKYNAQQAASSSGSAATSASNAATSASNAATSASNAASSASSASSSASAASASAAAAAAAAASGLYRQVLDKSANYTIVAADQGTLFRGNTGSGAITFTMPLISTVTDGFKVSIVKWTSDANPVNITRSGSDTINGATSAQIGSQYSQIILVADFETNTWFASQSGLGATNMNVDVFSGNGSTTAFTLSSDPGSKNNTDVFIGGVHQDHSTYSTSGTTLTFSTAPPSGTSNIEVCYGTPLPIGTPSDGTVTTAKIVDANVTTSKLADGAATTAKHADASITPVKMANGGAEFGFRNRIINGDMRIDQRNVGASATPSAVSSFVYTLDRWWYFATQASKFTIQRNAGGVTPPNGFTNYIGLTVASAVTPGAADQFIFGQSIEGFNFSDFAWGTAAARPVTISFWVRSSLTGQFSVALENLSGTRTYAATYTITAANTWQNVTVTIPGETSGTWSTDNTLSTYVIFDLGVGANQQTTGNVWFSGGANAATGNVKLVQTSGATFYVTGIQLEVGSVATPFERRQFGQELTLCQRYFQKTYKIDVALGTTGANTGYVEWNWGGLVSYATVSMFLRTTMRTYPTFQSYNVATGAAGGFVYYNGSTSVNGTGTLNGFDLGTDVVTWYMDATGRTNLQFHYTMTAEL